MATLGTKYNKDSKKKPFIQEMSSTDLQRYKDRELGIVHRRRHPMGKEASTVLALARGVM